jgi:outer membrane protein
MLNKINLAMNVILLALVAFLFFRDSDSVSESEKEVIKEEILAEADSLKQVADTVPSIGSNARIVYVNAERLNEEYEFISEKYEELEKEQMRIENQIDRKMRAAEDRYRELEGQAPTMTPSQLEQAQMELQGLQQDIAQFQEKATSDFRRKEAKAQEDFFKNIRSFLKEYNADGRYDYILTYQVGGQILLTNEMLDISQEVIDGLNQKHRGASAKKE